MAEPVQLEKEKNNSVAAGNQHEGPALNNEQVAITPPPYGITAEDKELFEEANLIGYYTEPHRILIPNDAGTDIKYDYFKQVILNAGGKIKEKPGEINLVGIRGVARDNQGNLIQTSSAHTYKQAMEGKADLTKQNHFTESQSARNSEQRKNDTSEKHGNWDDVIVSLWIDEENMKQVSIRKGSVDPEKTGNKNGASHLGDGQYKYKLGTHSTKIEDHKKIAKEFVKKHPELKADQKNKKKYTYQALRPISDLDVFRDDSKMEYEKVKGKKRPKGYSEQPDAKGYFTPEVLRERKKNKKKKPKLYTSRAIANNIHSGGENKSYSEGCINLPPELYVDLIKEVQQSTNKESIYFTLIDASKIGIQIIRNKVINPSYEQFKESTIETVDAISNYVSEILSNLDE